ncbi:MAG: hypothetical protein ACOZIN_06710 [Myxococcota bacterium]
MRPFLWLVLLAGSSSLARSVVEATPPSASELLYVAEVGGNLEAALDTFERAFGPSEAQAFLEGAPLPYLALEMLAGSPGRHGLNRKGGLGLFREPSFEGAVGLLQVVDEKAAVMALAGYLAEVGAQGREEGGLWRFVLFDGSELLALVDRGFLYLAMPDADVFDQGEPERVAALIRGAPGTGLAQTELMQRLQAKVAKRNVSLFVREPWGAVGVKGLLLSARLGEARTELDGFAVTAQPVLQPGEGASPTLLARAPAGPTLWVSAQLDPDALFALFAGAQGSPRRAQVLTRARAAGLDAEKLLPAVGGSFAAALYVDGRLLLTDIAQDDGVFDPLGTVILESAVRDAAAMKRFVSARLAEAAGGVARMEEQGGLTRFRARVQGQPVEASVDRNWLRLVAGPSLVARALEDVTVQMRRGLGQGAFGPGHFTAALDVAELRRQVEAPRGVRPEEVEVLWPIQLFLSRLLASTEISRVGLDVSAEDGGARLRAVIHYGEDGELFGLGR